MPSKPPLDDAHRDAGDALPVGTRLAEFELRSVLGVGGFGIVYRAWDHALEREVALKEYMPSTLASRGRGLHVSLRSSAHAETFAIGLRSFVNEARMLARFDHASLVKVYRFWEEHGTAYMVMPYYRGRTLRQVRQAMDEPPDEAACRQVVEPLLSALELLHRQDVYHRDIAPDNILVGDDGLPVLLDFGAARRAVTDRTQSLTAILKPNFAPLEQYADVSSMRQGPWTDLYGLGATVYYLITGESPMPAAARALHDELVPLFQVRPPGFSEEFLAAMDWALALRPPDRPQSVVVLRDVLDGRMGVPATVRRDATQPGVTARSVGGWSTQSIAPTMTLPPPVERPVVPESGESTEPEVDESPQSSSASHAEASRPSAPRRTWRRPPVMAAVAVAAVIVAALGWTLVPRPSADAAVLSAAATEPGPRAAQRRVSAGTPVRDALAVPADSITTARAATPRPRRTAERTALPADPRERCGDRRFISLLACVKRECERPEVAAHPECRRMADLESPPVQP
jgi:serine/threonine protein kinase